MSGVRISAILFFAFIAFARAQDSECIDLQDWCTTLGSDYCGSSEDMRTFCPKTCDACLPPECEECEHNCTSEDDGTHYCSCLTGYELMDDRKSCEDVDECSNDTNVCDDKLMCRNYPGGYECMEDICIPFHGKKYIRSYSYETTCCKRTGGECGQNRQNVASGRIIGGRKALRGMWPWQALVILGRDLCGGSLINMEWMVSAAHCFESITNVAGSIKYKVYFGVVDMNELELPLSQSRIIAEIIMHEDYDFPRNDIALVRLNKALVKSDFVSPVCLPNGDIPDVGTKCFTTGFGVTAQGSSSPSSTLQQVDVPIVDGAVCKKAYENTRDIFVDEMVCAGYKKGEKDACQGDSGGPLVCQRCDNCDWYLVGVTSFGEGCATPDFYGVYSNVVNYEKWMESKVSSVKIEERKCQPPQWTSWKRWSNCNKQCGGGSQSRIRICSNGEIGLPGCLGSDIDTRPCNTQACAKDSWTEWTVCSKTCGRGQQTRQRICVTSSCSKRTQRRNCNTQECPFWRQWSSWGQCTKDCSVGSRTRTRRCQNGDVGQSGCEGKGEEKEPCNTRPCPGWSNWSTWSQCTVTCGGGRQTTRRTCQNGVVGLDCIGSSTRGKNCNTRGCPEPFGPWSRWSACTKTCGGGEQSRTRTCPTDNCLSDDFGSVLEQTRKCRTAECPGKWTAWSPWDECSKSCGSGSRTRIRSCIGGSKCPGKGTESELCNTRRCVGNWSKWSSFGPCDVTCGSGSRVRRRSCENGENCPGRNTDEETCSPRPCPVWSDWKDWTTCSATCEGGQQSRARTCGIGPEDDGLCPGDDQENRSCGEGPCQALCDQRCTVAVRWGYCRSEREWMDNFCQIDCCGPSVCKDTASYCSVSQKSRCVERQYFYDCVATCGFCS